ncbi:MAG: hypothetical protein IH571_04755 [Acholeplasmataceae bacterium]|nr:hypothetical protein [Acholeplasmataceae bacterium]
MKKLTSDVFKFSSVLVGVLATLMIVFPALILKDSAASLTGLNAAFGHEFASFGSFVSGNIKFSLMTVIAYLLPLLGALVLLFTKKGYLISTLAFTAAAILLFLVPEFTVITITVGGIENEIAVEWTYGLGLLFAASLSIVGVVIGLSRIYKSKKKKISLSLKCTL